MMTWGELLEVLHENFLHGDKDLDDNVTVYDATDGEFYPADTIEFTESDDILDAGHMFISINAEKYSEQKDNT